MKIFEPREQPVVTVALGPRREASRVGAGAGLGQRVAAERLARGRASAATPRRCSSVPHLAIVLPTSPIVHRDDPPHRRVGAAELLHHEAVRDRVEPHPAGSAAAGAQEADLGELADDRAVHRPRRGPSRARAGRPRVRRTRARCSRISSCSGVSVKSTARFYSKRDGAGSAGPVRRIPGSSLATLDQGPNSRPGAVVVADDLHLVEIGKLSFLAGLDT